LFAEATGPSSSPEVVGRTVAQDLLSQDAKRILQSVADG